MNEIQVALYTNSISPHQVPLAKEIVNLVGGGAYRYIYTSPLTEERRRMGWGDLEHDWIVSEDAKPDYCRTVLNHVRFLLCGLRDFRLIEQRAENGLETAYVSERWFKPWLGFLRIFWPPYFAMACHFVRLLSVFKEVLYFPMGIHAARDMARLAGLLHGDILCLFRSPELEFDKEPYGRVWLKGHRKDDGLNRKYCLNKMRIWGYYVARSAEKKERVKWTGRETKALRLLWVGRFLRWKRVDTIIRAVCEYESRRHAVDESLPSIVLDIYGVGRDKARLLRKAHGAESIIRFHPSVKIEDVRTLMRNHDVYVLSSNGAEGWGAVLNEALEEGMIVLGTVDAGSSATILDDKYKFHAGDWRRLWAMLWQMVHARSEPDTAQISRLSDTWSAANAAKTLIGSKTI